ncbi:hypothetical protein EYR41_004944 [Orbilia oligospora]|uniref:Uncharacterized protein n=1 Tax=Orbilia oligospora TaxID=2813651 RepID=A0A7C8U5N1_ORBOL|nr:hypothetical protein TWF751_009347 [Orbilia oligospora]TGJ68862.1 hypothetical protein EYR41_004944 [Orbilia oligospora]
MENPAAQQPFLRLVETNIVLMCRPDTYTAAVNHLQNHCLQHNKEVLDNLDLESGSNKQYQDQISLWRAHLARESTGASAEIVFPNQYFGNFNGRATGLYNGTINFIQGPLDPTLPRAKRRSYWEGLRAKHHDIHGICLVIPSSDEARHSNARVSDWIQWCDNFHQQTLPQLFSQKVELYIIHLNLITTYNANFSRKNWLGRGIRQFHLGSQQGTVRFLKTVIVDMPPKKHSIRDNHLDSEYLDQDDSSPPILKKARLWSLNKVLVIAVFEMRELLQTEYLETVKQYRAIEDSVQRIENEIRMFELSLLQKENERAYLTTPEKLELMKDISQRYQRTFEFNIKTESHIRYFDLDPPEVVGKWDPIHPPTVDPINPKRFIGKLTDTEALPFIKSRLLRGTDIQGSDWFTLRLFGYRHEIHAKEVRIIENEIQQIQKNLQNTTSLLESLTEQQKSLYKSNETQKEMLSICRKDIQRLDHTDQLDWDFDKVRQYLAESSIREISSEYGLKSCIPKEISPLDLQIPKIKAMGVDVFKILSGKSGEQLIHILETFVPRLKSYEDSIQQSFGATISTGLMKIKLGVPTIFEQENIWGEDEDEDDEWSETRSQLRSKSEEYLSPGSDAFSKPTEAATKNHEEDYTNLLRKAVDVKKTLKDKWNTSLELSETFRTPFFEGVTKFHEEMETLRSKEIRELFILDTKAFKDGEAVHESDFLEIGTYANLLHQAAALQAISDFL